MFLIFLLLVGVSASFDWENPLLGDLPCNIDIQEFDFSNPVDVEAYKTHYKDKFPVAFPNPGYETFKNVVSLSNLHEFYRNTPVLLSGSNSYSSNKRATILADYLDNHMDPILPDRLANETHYLFGDTFEPEWMALVADYPFPADSEGDNGLRVFGLGSRYSGVAFHTHGPAFAHTVIGRKRWWLSSPSERPDFNPDVTQLQWTLSHPTSALPKSMLYCTFDEKYLLYIPAHWWHATLNLDDYNAFVSVFTQ